MAASGLRALLLLSLLISAFACHRSPDPESRATELLTRSQGDDDWARSRWRLEPQNWDLGLNATAPWKGPDSTATVETTRDLRTQDLLGCLPKGFSAPAYFQTSVTVAEAEGPVAVFHWVDLDAAKAGQKQVQAAVAATHGHEEKLYEAIQHEPSLDKACVTFAGRRNLCGGGESSG